MTHELARMIVYLYEFCGPGTLERLYYGSRPVADFNKQAAARDLFFAAQNYLNLNGYEKVFLKQDDESDEGH